MIIHSKKIFWGLLFILFFLFILSLTGQVIHYKTYYENAFGLIPLVNIALDLSIPTIFRVFILQVISLLLGLIALYSKTKQDAFYKHWAFLSICFAYITLNVGSYIHRLILRPLRVVIKGYFQNPSNTNMIITISIVFIITLLFYIKFIVSLPKRTIRNGLISLIVYFFGFLCLSHVVNSYAGLFGSDNLTSNILVMIRRLTEATGMVLCIYTLLDYIESEIKEIVIEF